MKKTTFALIFVCFHFLVSGQTTDSSRGNQKMNMGFLIGPNMIMINKTNSVGITLGAIANYNLTNNIAITFQPELTLNSYNQGLSDAPIRTSFLDIPLHFLWKPFNLPLKPFFAIGPDYKIDLEEVNKSFLSYDFSIGVEKKFAHLILDPEIRYSYSEQYKIVYLVLNFMGSKN